MMKFKDKYIIISFIFYLHLSVSDLHDVQSHQYHLSMCQFQTQLFQVHHVRLFYANSHSLSQVHAQRYFMMSSLLTILILFDDENDLLMR